MIQLLLIALVVGIFVHDADLVDRRVVGAVNGPLLAAVVLGPMLALGAIVWVACRRTVRRLRAARIHRLERVLTGCRLLLLPWYAAQLACGSLLWVRDVLGQRLVLVDEVLVMLPVLGVLLWTWWCYYPIDRRLREVALLRRLDDDLPVYAVWSRGQYLLAQLRHQVLLVFAPLLLILGWTEAALRYLPIDPRHTATMSAAVLAGTGVIFLLSPLMIRYIFDTVPLPPGEVRDRLSHLCAAHGVRVRELLLWRTFGGMINAAVMGVVAPVRYVMLTDALLDSLPRPQVEAVMAHELAHVRKHHMFWLLAFAFVAAAACDTLLSLLFEDPTRLSVALAIASSVAAAGWIAAFGWASRRMERQADAFAAAHLAREKQLQAVDDASATTMIDALQRVADLNHMRVAQRSWRHGSIRSRQHALRKLVGQPLRRHHADRAAAAVQLLTVALTLALALYHYR